MREPVKQFAEAMEAKLKTKDEEHGEEGWMDKKCTLKYLMNRFVEESHELHAAFDNCSPDELAAECVDIANFAMMMHQKLVRR